MVEDGTSVGCFSCFYKSMIWQVIKEALIEYFKSKFLNAFNVKLSCVSENTRSLIENEEGRGLSKKQGSIRSGREFAENRSVQLRDWSIPKNLYAKKEFQFVLCSSFIITFICFLHLLICFLSKQQDKLDYLFL